jgi:hypothetical protein
MKLHENSFCFSVLALSWLVGDASAFAADLIVSANDAKYVRVLGRDTYPEGAGPDTLTVLDASRFPPEVTLIDVSKRPFRAVQHFTVPSIPEGVAISPDGKWIAVQSMDGSNLTEDNPGRHPQGRVLLFAIRDGQAVKTSDLPGGEAGQGIVFTADNKYILIQFNVEKQLAVYAVNDGDMKDTQQRIVLSGGPASLRSMPR